MTKLKDPNVLSGITLAYVGDAVYEVLVREHLVVEGIVRPKQLQNTATKYVSAKAQAALITKAQDDDILRETELEIFLRGRNAKSYTHAKNTSVGTYSLSTGFEAVFGYLKLDHQDDRIKELAEWCITQVETGALHGYKFN